MDIASRTEIIEEFNRIQALGFLKSRRSHNTGIGKTFEDYLGVDENNLKDPDFKGFEVKSQRELASSYVTLFTKSPEPRGMNTVLRENFGIEYDKYPGLRKLHTSMFGNQFNSFYETYGFKLEVSDQDKKVFILVKDLSNDQMLFNEAYYDYDLLESTIDAKLNSLFFVTAKTKKNNGVELFHYTKAKIYYNLQFEKFIEHLKKGTIMYDIRIGVFKSGIKKGKTHDHGSGFRIKSKNLHLIFEDIFEVK